MKGVVAIAAPWDGRAVTIHPRHEIDGCAGRTVGPEGDTEYVVTRSVLPGVPVAHEDLVEDQPRGLLPFLRLEALDRAGHAIGAIGEDGVGNEEGLTLRPDRQLADIER